MSYPLTDIAGLDRDTAAILKSAAIKSTEALIEAARTSRKRKALAQHTGFSEKQLLCWANAADRMRVPGVRKDHATLLGAAGVNTVRDLKYRNPGKLAAAMKQANGNNKFVRLAPSEKVVTRWIDQAKKLPLKITY